MGEEELLAIILRHEQRLNRMDARDDSCLHVGDHPDERTDRLNKYLLHWQALFNLSVAELAHLEGEEMKARLAQLESLRHEASEDEKKKAGIKHQIRKCA